MFWSFAIIILKWLSMKQQKEAMLLDVLPTEVAEEIRSIPSMVLPDTSKACRSVVLRAF